MYAVIITGATFYVEADITEEQCQKIESCARGFIQSHKAHKDCNVIFEDFINIIGQRLGTKLTKVPIESVFRVS